MRIARDVVSSMHLLRDDYDFGVEELGNYTADVQTLRHCQNKRYLTKTDAKRRETKDVTGYIS